MSNTKSHSLSFFRRVPRSAIVAVLFFVCAAPVLTQTITTEELTAKHLDSIVPADKRPKVENFYVVGDSRFKMLGSPNVLAGKVIIMSDKDRSLWALNFRSNDYPQDKFVFDGKKVLVQRTNTEGRSLLAQFLYDNRKLIENGVFGGALSNSWVFLRNRGNAKFDVAGIKKINDHEVIVVDYRPKGGSDVTTKFYFDSKTFQHLRTEHTLTWAARQGSNVDDSARQNSTMVRVIEDFSDFKKMGDLTLPSTYKITYSQNGSTSLAASSSQSREAEWVFQFTNFAANQPLEANAFSTEN